MDSAKDRKSKADKTKALGVSWTSGKVNEDGTIPDDSAISISGKGVADGKLSIQKGNLAELYVIGTQDATPSDAVWWSDGAAVAVSGTGTVYGVQTGTAKVNVKVATKPPPSPSPSSKRQPPISIKTFEPWNSISLQGSNHIQTLLYA